MAQKTILISINSSWNIVNFRSGLIQALQREHYRVVALAPPDGWSARFAEMGVEFLPIEIDNKGLSPRRDLKLLRDYRAALRTARPDVFLGYTAKPNIYGSMAAHGLGIPVVNNVSGLGTAFIRENWLTQLVSALYRRAFRRSATVFFQNSEDLGLFLGKGLVRPNQARLLPGSGIDLSRYRPQIPQGEGDGIAFLLVARLLRDKGVGEFVEAARLVRRQRADVTFRLLGPVDAANRTAVTQAEVRTWVDEGVIDYLGAMDDVRPAIAAADCVVLPSYREGLPRTLLEGAAMAKPLIASDVPGCRDVVADGSNGLLCRARDAQSLADAMLRMAALTRGERSALGRAGRAMVEERFDERLVHQSYVDAVREALAIRR